MITKKAICTFNVWDEVPDKEAHSQFVSYYHTAPPQPLMKTEVRKFTVEVPIVSLKRFGDEEEQSGEEYFKEMEKLCAPIFKGLGYMLTAVQYEEVKDED